MDGQASESRSADFGELIGVLLEQSERALEEGDVDWCAVVQGLLIPRVEREIFVAA